MDNISWESRSDLKEEFQESDLPFEVDVLSYNDISENFKNLIRPDLETVKISSQYVPHPDVAYPVLGYKPCVFLKNIIKNKNIIVGDYTYYHDVEDVYNFERNVLYFYDFIVDKLSIGKFCSIAQGCKFIMNGGMHPMSGMSTYPFKTYSGFAVTNPTSYQLAWNVESDAINKGDTIIGNDVWIGYNATILPGVTVGDGAIIGANSTVTKNVAPYTIVAGNPAKVIRKRFDDDTIAKLLTLQWWNLPIDQINKHIRDIALDIRQSQLLDKALTR